MGPSHKISSISTDYLSITFISRKSAFHATGHCILSSAKIIVQICALRKQGEKCFFLGVRRPSYIVHALPSPSGLTSLGYPDLYEGAGEITSEVPNCFEV